MANDQPPNTATLRRRRVYFSGRVQGVGFRYTTQHLASTLEVTGIVRNLADGRVEMIAEGASAELDRLLEVIDRTMAGNITSKVVSDSEPTGEYAGFQITF